ncbi:unnamed protein product [Blepharisma stoltei]|uniref:PPM-type phosphatase domain-containing protein n=1 Tax=Blepharisma stoltei TaxID=1481888 RepID=A0AAU9IUQ6_9CILI|nr:unnamed protein product [Blepharisma stoltei]
MERRIPPFSPVFRASREDVKRFNLVKLSNAKSNHQLKIAQDPWTQKSFLNKSESENKAFKKSIKTAESSRQINGDRLKVDYTGLIKSQSSYRILKDKLPSIEKERTNSPNSPINNENKKERILSQLSHLPTPKISTRINFTPKIADKTFSDTTRIPQKKRNVIHSVCSRTGKTAGKLKKFNQDSYIICTNFCCYPDQYLFSILDGHGIYGHIVSDYVKINLPQLLEGYLPVITRPHFFRDNSAINSTDMSSLKQAFKKCYARLQKDLVLKSHIDISFSGTTACTVLIHENHLFCANVGDSRAVLGQLIDGHWIALALSRDHKPNEHSERLRIEKSGGRVEQMKDPSGNHVGPYRVWLQSEDIPGLAMARSLGDAVGASAGVISDPEVNDIYLSDCDKFLIIGSDGVWEFIENLEAVEIVAKFWETGDAEGASQKLTKEAYKKWKKLDVTDDTTAIVVFLNPV